VNYLKDTSIDECVDKADCVLAGKYSHNITEPECITGPECVIAGAFKNEPWKDCSANCPATEDFKYKELTTDTCVTKAECTGTFDFYSQNSTLTCVGSCLAAEYTIESYQDCDPTCSSAGLYNRDSDMTCYYKADCHAESYVTKEDTTECLSEAECLAVTPSQVVVPASFDCLNGCPASEEYKHTPTRKCYDAPNCVSLPGYTLNTTVSGADPTCEDSCPNPFFHNEVIKDCDDSCPTGLFGTTTAPFNCLSDEQCWTLSSDHWVIPSTDTCEDNCAFYKDYGFRRCLVTCDASVSETDVGSSECYSEFKIFLKKTSRKPLAGETNRVEVTLEYDMGYLDITKPLITELKTVQGGIETIIPSTDFEIKNTQEFRRRALAVTTTHVSQFLIYFTVPTK
jgi:hypothetical protein